MLGISVGVGTGVVHARAGLASLNLDFTASQVDSRISFTRATSKTYLGSNGYIQTAGSGVWPVEYDINGVALGRRVDEQRTNRVLYSEQEDNAYWQKTFVAVLGNQAIAPDNSGTADLVFPIGTNDCRIQKQFSVVSGTVYTTSFFAKAAGLTWLRVYPLPFTAPAWFDVENGQLGTVSSGTTAQIEDYGNGWYRCSVTRTATSTTTGQLYINIVNANGVGTVTPNGDDGVYIWGAQVEDAPFASPYIPTPASFTSRASTATYTDSSGVIQSAAIDVARTGYLNIGGTYYSQGLLLEAASTNLVLQSEDFSTTWVTANLTVTADNIDAPDGAATADLLNATLGGGVVVQAPTFTGNGEKCVSVFLKQGSAGVTDVEILDTTASASRHRVRITWSTLAVTTQAGGGTIYPLETLADGWYRLKFSATGIVAANSNEVRVYPAGNAGIGTVYAWGAQAEDAIVPSSYIPTTTATVTRSADVSSSATVTRNADQASLTGTNFSDWYNATEKTMFVDWYQGDSELISSALGISDGGNNNRMIIWADNSNSATITSGFQVTAAASVVVAMTLETIVSGSNNKIAASYKLNDFAASQNGAAPSTDTSGAIPVVDRANIGAGAGATAQPLNGVIKTFRYYPIALPDATLQTLTS